MKNLATFLTVLLTACAAAAGDGVFSGTPARWFGVDFGVYTADQPLSGLGAKRGGWNLDELSVGSDAAVVTGDPDGNYLEYQHSVNSDILSLRGDLRRRDAVKEIRFRAKFSEVTFPPEVDPSLKTAISVVATDSEPVFTNFIALVNGTWTELYTEPMDLVPAEFERWLDVYARFERSAGGPLTVVYSVSNTVTGAFGTLYTDHGECRLPCADPSGEGIREIDFTGDYGRVGGVDAYWNVPFDVRVR